ncbi:PEPxxWA-CTERM sorting domain-containing protein [Sphingomonas nostoxanthinifaciens]|uniref:PEPxxWA-CTERM sorting domain-containing protein n=1 Tax=Sphingomonas nostoxanthinifaciens TaxID=2872652 RepID=UPI001CC21750|nr:PEPxxWA-CTERM sorting domain-containing protein [Sphingomonas nostoxanthinifaciens]
MKKILAAAALVSAFAIGSAASAATLLVSVVGPDAGTFEIDSNPTPYGVYVDPYYHQDHFFVHVSNQTGFFDEILGVSFFSSGGAIIQYSNADYTPLTGAKLFTGSVNNPFITIGSFMAEDADGFKYSITISNAPAVPEPASWAMMVGGFGVVGGAMRRRQRVSVSFG